MAWSAACGELFFFLAAVCSGSLGRSHTASQYSLHLSSCLTNILIHALAAASILFPCGCCAAARVTH